MALNFDPGAYAQIFEAKQNRDQQRQQLLAQSLNQIPEALAGYAQSQKQDALSKMMMAYKTRELGIQAGAAGYDPEAATQGLPGASMPPVASPAASPAPSMGSWSPSSMAPDSPGPVMPLPDQRMASGGTPDNGNLAQIANDPNQHPLRRAIAQYGMKQTSQPSMGQPSNGSVFQRPNVDYNGVMNDMKTGKYDSFNSLNEKQKADMKELPAYKSMLEKPAASYSPEDVADAMKGNWQAIAQRNGGKVPESLTRIGTSAINSDAKNQFYGARGSQIFMNELPSNTSPSLPAGAAYAVKVAVRQGQSLIKNAGSPQAIALAASDLARAVQRSAPQMDVIRGGGFSDNFVNRLNLIAQKFTADPNAAADVPKVRKEIFDMLSDLDKSAQPWIDNKLQDIETNFAGQLPSNWNQMKRRQQGNDIAPVQFDDGSGNGGGQAMTATNKQTGQRIQSLDGGKTWQPAR